MPHQSPCLWNQLSCSLRQPHSSICVSDLPVHAPTTYSHYVNQFTTLAIHNSLCLSLPAQDVPHSQTFPTGLPSGTRTESTDFITDRFFWAPRFLSVRELTFTFAICYRPIRPSVCLSVVCNARASYSGGSSFRQYFYGIWYLGHPRKILRRSSKGNSSVGGAKP